jgi:hypothetical protein
MPNPAPSHSDDWTNSDAPVVACDHCGEVRPCVFSGDPFLAELYPEDDNPLSMWCGPCYRNRHDEV